MQCAVITWPLTTETFAKFLVSRDVPAEKAADFLNPTLEKALPDPLQLLDMNKAVDRIVLALQRNELIAIFGDYDVDGATSSAMLHRFLQGAAGGRVRVYIPNRETEGYGPNVAAMKRLKQEGASVVITVDCGMTAHKQLAEAKAMGLDVIVVDHHLPDANTVNEVCCHSPRVFVLKLCAVL